MAGLKDIAKTAGINDDLAERIIEAIGATLERGEAVRIRGLGSFTPVEKGERTFKTSVMHGRSTTKPAHTAIKFSSSTILNKRLNRPKTSANG